MRKHTAEENKNRRVASRSRLGDKSGGESTKQKGRKYPMVKLEKLTEGLTNDPPINGENDLSNNKQQTTIERYDADNEVYVNNLDTTSNKEPVDQAHEPNKTKELKYKCTKCSNAFELPTTLEVRKSDSISCYQIK